MPSISHLRTVHWTTCLQGEAREVGRHIVELVTTNSSELVYNDNIACLFSDKSTFDAFQTLVKEHKRLLSFIRW